ncbi:MAG TPA: glycoside hydrolase, partial [Candidatus Binatia bacterium]
YRQMAHGLVEPFTRADLTAVLREMERRFGGSSYSLRSLFRDEQRKVSKTILAVNLQEAESLYRQIYEPHEALLRFLTDLGIPLPKGFSAAADFVLNNQLRAALEQPAIDLKRVIGLLEAARLEGVTLETAALEFTYRQSLERLAAALAAEGSLSALERLQDAMHILPHLPFTVDLWQVQNFYFQLLTRHYPFQREAQRRGEETARRWIACFQDLGRMLRIKVPE